MVKQGGKVIRFFLILLIFLAGFFYHANLRIDANLRILQPNYASAQELAVAGEVVINEIQAYGDSAVDDWIELYNPTDNDIDLTTKNYRIEKAVSANPSLIMRIGNISDGSYPGGTIISAKGFYLIVRDDANADLLSKADAIGTKSSFTWGGTGYTLYLGNGTISDDNDSDVIDKVGFGSAIYYEGSNPAPEIPNNESIERQQPGYDTDNNSADFEIQNSPNPQNSGGEPESEPEPEPEPEEEDLPAQAGGVEDTQGDDDEEGTELLSPETTESDSVPSYILGDVVINEFVSDPSDEDTEWVELYNTTGNEIDLTGWSIEEGSGAKTSLDGVIGNSGGSKFLVVLKPKGKLNNKGDIIILRDGNDNLIDQVAYGNWDDGNIDNNAPVTGDPYSIARKFDGQNSFNNLNDFAVTTMLTKGASNIITVEQDEEEKISAEDRASYDYSNDIIISEIFPNPEGSDTDSEFIELYNKGDRDVDLTGWKLGDESKKRYEFKVSTVEAEIASPAARNDNIILAGDYLVVYRSESGIALNNTTDSVKLYQPLKDEPMQIVEYEDVVEEWSYNLEKSANLPAQAGVRQKDKWQWSEIVTPGEVNVVLAVNHAPEVVIELPTEFLVGVSVLFDTSDTVDEDGDELTFSWDFGDGLTNSLASPGHTYLQAGNYVVNLVVSDGENEVEEERIVNVVSESGEINKPRDSIAALQNDSDKVIISEVLPNPEGTDKEGEWVEIQNVGTTKINLLNWIIDDGEGGSKPYRFDSDIWLEVGEFLTLDRVDSGLAFNNSVDAVRLYNNYEELIDEIEYEKVVEGESYARGANGKLFWTTVLTPGSENIISVAGTKSVAQADKTISGNSGSVSSSKAKVVVATTLEKIKEMESGELVKVAGVVAVEPGVLGSQYFYIVGSPPPENVEQILSDVGGQDLPENVEQPERTGQAPPERTGQAGIQVYSYKKDFPVLKVGDYIEVNGELAVSNGEMRIKTKVADDMKIIEHRDEPLAEALSSDKINEETVGALITVTGEVVERKSSIVYLDDGTDEVIVYLKTSTGINPKSIEEGEILQVTGIVGRTKSGIRIMPRSNDDIIKKDVESGNVGIGQVLGEVAVSDEWAIAERDKKLELFKYLLVIAGTIIIVLGGLLVREFRK